MRHTFGNMCICMYIYMCVHTYLYPTVGQGFYCIRCRLLQAVFVAAAAATAAVVVVVVVVVVVAFVVVAVVVIRPLRSLRHRPQPKH